MERIKSPEIDPYKYAPLIFHKSAKAIQFNGGKTAFPTNGAGTSRYP